MIIQTSAKELQRLREELCSWKDRYEEEKLNCTTVMETLEKEMRDHQGTKTTHEANEVKRIEEQAALDNETRESFSRLKRKLGGMVGRYHTQPSKVR